MCPCMPDGDDNCRDCVEAFDSIPESSLFGDHPDGVRTTVTLRPTLG